MSTRLNTGSHDLPASSVECPVRTPLWPLTRWWWSCAWWSSLYRSHLRWLSPASRAGRTTWRKTPAHFIFRIIPCRMSMALKVIIGGSSLEFQVPGGWAWRRRAETTVVKWGAAWGLLGKPQRPGLGRDPPPLTQGRSGCVPWSPGWRRWQSQHKHWWHSWLCWWWCCLCIKWRSVGKGTQKDYSSWEKSGFCLSYWR